MLSDTSIFKKTFKNGGQSLEIVFDNLGTCTLSIILQRGGSWFLKKKFSKDWSLWLIKKKNIFKLYLQITLKLFGTIKAHAW